jgi:signal transduction histidine kinase
MRREIEKVNELLLDFIQFSKPLNRQSLNVISLNEILDEIVDSFKFSYDEKFRRINLISVNIG